MDHSRAISHTENQPTNKRTNQPRATEITLQRTGSSLRAKSLPSPHRIHREIRVSTTGRRGPQGRCRRQCSAFKGGLFSRKRRWVRPTLKLATFKRENFHSQKAVLKLGQQQRLGPYPPPLLWPHLAFCCETIRHRGPFTWRTGRLSYKNPIYFQWFTAELGFRAWEGRLKIVWFKL